MTQRVVLALLLVTAAGLAQSPEASIRGEVTDATGAALAGARVTATNAATKVATVAISNNAGAYLITNLAVGEYAVTVNHEGFRQYREVGIMLNTAESLGLNVKMELGAVTESITVNASAAALEDKTSIITQTFEPKEVADLPLGDQRTMYLLNLAAGAVFVGYSGSIPSFSLGGGRSQSQMAWMDGGSNQNMRLGIGQMAVDPPIASIEEVKVLSNNYSAEYGATSGGVILETTKSGTNTFHGSGYEFLRNDFMNAAGFFAPVVNGSKTIPELRYNIYGATLGGPVRRNRTFFFFGYEGRRLGIGSTTILTVPTLLQRQGNFSQTLSAAGAVIPIYDPASTQLIDGKQTRNQFSGNVIPQSSLDPVAVKALNYWPLPNTTPSSISGGNNFKQNIVSWTDSVYYTGKVDHLFNDKDRLTGRYLYSHNYPKPLGPYGPNDIADPTFGYLYSVEYFYANETHIFSPSTVNDLRFNYGYSISHGVTNGVGSDAVTTLGLTGVSDNAFPSFAPASGFSAIGATQQERRQYPIVDMQFVDNLSKVVGRHALKFGMEARKSANDEVDLFTSSGTFSFATTPTGQPGVASSGNGLASLLVGFPTSFAAAQTLPIDRRTWYLGAFAQDDFTISRGLTLNVGIRWEMDTPMVDTHDRLNGFDNEINPVSGTPGVVRFMGVNGFPTTAWNYDWNNFGPRFGFAWRPQFSSRLVFRGGYGVFFSHPFDAGQPASANLGFGTSVSLGTPDNGITAPFYLRNGVPAVTTSVSLNNSYGAVPVGGSPTTAVTFFDPVRVTGYSQQANLNVQYQISSSIIVEVTGMSNQSHKLPNSNESIDQILPGVLGSTCSTQACRPYPQFSNVTVLSPDNGDSRYFGGFVRLTKRFSKGLNLNTSYTHSKFLDDTFEGGSTAGQNLTPYSNQYNRRADWGPSGNDIENRFSFSSVYELPFGPGRQFFQKGVIGNIIGAWTIGTVASAQTGGPFTVTTNTNDTNSFSTGNQRANVLGDPNLPAGQRKVNEWFNIAEFTQPAQFTFGNSGRGIMRGPGLVNVDLALSRTFRLREGIDLRFRGGAFNLFNHTNLSAPGPTFGTANFGSIVASGPARVLEIGAKVTF